MEGWRVGVREARRWRREVEPGAAGTVDGIWVCGLALRGKSIVVAVEKMFMGLRTWMGLICANWNGTYSMYVRAKAKIVELIHLGEWVASCFRRDTYPLCHNPL